MNKEEFENQPIRDLIFDPMLYKEYPYHYAKENKIIFSKLPILEPSLEEEIKYKQLKSNWNDLKQDIGYELLKLREPNEYNEGLCNAFNYINNKMQELEEGD